MATPNHHPSDWLRPLAQQLAPRFGEQEAKALARRLVEHHSSLTFTELLVQKPSSTWDPAAFQADADRLAAGEPLQYVLGFAEFRGLRLAVDPRVLIPRPETEELAQWVLDSLPSDQALHLLDICTGSGCIPLSLKAERSAWLLHAVDLSPDALALAQQNATTLGLDVAFRQGDLWDPTVYQANFLWDALISNPPYIPETLYQSLDAHVRDWEPKLALAVADAAPLAPYQAIAKQGLTYLTPGGSLFFECHDDYVSALADLLDGLDYHAVETRVDFNGKPRMIRAVR